MRKYIQLTLILVAIASISLMLLYERKYSKVKMILEILNGFNYKETPPKPEPSLETTREPYFISNPSWSHLAGTFNLYSAYWQNASEGRERTVLVLATSTSPPDSHDLHCYLWYEGQTEPVMGNAQLKDYTSDSSVFFISCSYLGNNFIPYGIVVSYKSTNSSFISVTAFTERFQTAVCLETLPVGFQDAVTLAEFLIFHQHTGVNYFIIYEKGLSPLIRRLIHRAKRSGYHLDILHWNYPAGEQDKDAQNMDCLARSFLVHGSTTVATLKLGQFLVPKSASNLTDSLARLEDASSCMFSTYRFCTEYPMDVVAETLGFPFVSLKYTKRQNSKEKSSALLYRNSVTSRWNYGIGSTHTVPASDVVLYVYGSCNLPPHQFNTNYSEDVTMTSYKNIFFTSPLYRYLEKRSLFTK